MRSLFIYSGQELTKHVLFAILIFLFVKLIAMGVLNALMQFLAELNDN